MEEINIKLISFGYDGVDVLQVFKLMWQHKWLEGSPFHACCPLCYTLNNLDVQTLSVQPLVHKLEGLLQATYTYFSSSPKRHLE
jgi:hypothetical protein